jgi:hypothetical protein
MKIHISLILCVLMLGTSGAFALEDGNSAMSNVSTTRLKKQGDGGQAGQGQSDGSNSGKQKAAISTTRSNIKRPAK